MHAIETVVHRFIEKGGSGPKLVINLGCGYDPMPFQFWHRFTSLCEHVTFVDVDYPQLIEKKRALISGCPPLQDALISSTLRYSEPPIYVRSDRYMAVGCDLRDLSTLSQILKPELTAPSCSILFVGEVSLTYMNVDDSDSLIRWANSFPNSTFCLLEQYLPDGPEHPFARTMLKHFNKLHTPIHAVERYPLLSQQEARFMTSGWLSVSARNLWGLWSDSSFISDEQRRQLDQIEPFDEWEEFALFAGHYFLLVATNASCSEPLNNKEPRSGQENVRVVETHVTCEISPFLDNRPITPRRFGAACALNSNTLMVQGGQSVQHRLSSVDVLTRPGSDTRMEYLPAAARMCHTMTAINGGDILLVGGRTSPNRPMADCWFSKDGYWIRTQDIEPARFRHNATRIVIPTPGHNTDAVLVFGGKTGGGDLLEDWKLWTPMFGWQDVTVSGHRPAARFGSTFCSMGDAQGLLLGGVGSDGVILEDIWEWKLVAHPKLELQLTDRTRDLDPGSSPTYARVGASLLPCDDCFLLIGGSAKDHILNSAEDILALYCGDTLWFGPINLQIPSPQRLLLVGFGAASVSEEEIVVVGGGAVCFSMGSFWNTEYISIVKKGRELRSRWEPSPGQKVVRVQHSKSQVSLGPTTDAHHCVQLVPKIKIESSAEFLQVLAASQPVILEGLDIGPCVNSWSANFLKDKIGNDRSIVIHECADEEMSFLDKNFSYSKMAFGDFMDGVVRGEKMYLRSISTSQPTKVPTKLEEDFPTIAKDFHLPDILSPVLNKLHSSPLRISGPVSLWLHYDVLANILCQITGSKTLQLYPPGDVKHLGFPPGGSSSNIRIEAAQRLGIIHTHPYKAHLNPGDILFIPPLWAHSATPEAGFSVAVNVFFRSLDTGYAAGKDVYGNRDLQAYENGRRDVARIAKAFGNIPKDMANFYLQRLAVELQNKADEYGS
jgi:tRNA wybutosine-synthesizing protein 4